MSANPEAFEFLRNVAYKFVQKSGKDSRKLLDHCAAALTAWRDGDGAGSGLTDAEAASLIGDVHHWTITEYNIPRRRAVRSREERAAEIVLAPHLMELAEELHGRATVRNAARVSGQSKSTLARHLKDQGVAPKRREKVAKLPAPVQRLIQILEETFPRDSSGLLSVDELGFALWDGLRRDPRQPFPQLARSTLWKRRKTMKQYLQSIHSNRIGFNISVSGDLVIVRQGRKFPDLKELAVQVEEERRRKGIRAVSIPVAKPKELFWSDSWLMAVLETYKLGLNPFIEDAMRLEPMLRLMRLSGNMLIDTTPVYRCAAAAIRLPTMVNEFPSSMIAVARRISEREPLVARHVHQIGVDLAWFHHEACKSVPAVHLLAMMHLRLKFMAPLLERAPDSYARIRYVEEILFASIEDAYDAPGLWRGWQTGEAKGEWHPPREEELRSWIPVDEIPF